ncbi:MAG: type VII toxin-antitoxin system HepT family RNase toxin [Vicinamibacterales bacterium]
MTLNADLVRARCLEIEQSCARLDALRTLTVDEFIASQDTLDIACYRLLVAVEASLALCYHVSARQLRETPDDYPACFATLGRAGVIPGALAERLQRMARFRNLLVHVYWKIDYRQVYDIVQRDTADLRQFASVMAARV